MSSPENGRDFVSIGICQHVLFELADLEVERRTCTKGPHVGSRVESDACRLARLPRVEKRAPSIFEFPPFNLKAFRPTTTTPFPTHSLPSLPYQVASVGARGWRPTHLQRSPPTLSPMPLKVHASRTSSFDLVKMEDRKRAAAADPDEAHPSLKRQATGVNGVKSEETFEWDPLIQVRLDNRGSLSRSTDCLLTPVRRSTRKMPYCATTNSRRRARRRLRQGWRSLQKNVATMTTTSARLIRGCTR
jgi:hypothetical protein